MVTKKTATDIERAIANEHSEILVAAKESRENAGLSQRQLAAKSGVQQPVIARMEQGKTSPQMETVLKVLYPLDKKLAVVSLEEKGGDAK